MRLHGFWPLWDFHVRFHAVWALRDFYEISSRVFMLFGPPTRYEISLWVLLAVCCVVFVWDFTCFFAYDISLWYFDAFCSAIFVCDFLLKLCASCCTVFLWRWRCVCHHDFVLLLQSCILFILSRLNFLHRILLRRNSCDCLTFFFSTMSLFDFTRFIFAVVRFPYEISAFWPLYETSWDVMRFNAFGSLCEFLVNCFCVLLDNFLVRCHAFLTVMRFMRFHTFCCVFCSLTYVSPKSPPWVEC